MNFINKCVSFPLFYFFPIIILCACTPKADEHTQCIVASEDIITVILLKENRTLESISLNNDGTVRAYSKITEGAWRIPIDCKDRLSAHLNETEKRLTLNAIESLKGK